eukprot:COSAG04_NODE_387_length_15288_cov_17.787609_8_plen_247_part_00
MTVGRSLTTRCCAGRWNSQLTCKGDGTTTISPKDQCGHPTWHSTKAFQGYWPQQDSLKGGLLYAEADAEGVAFTKPELPIIPGMAYDTKQKKNVVFSNTSNILLQAYADPNRGVIYDTHDANASRRYKAFGSFWKDGQWGKQKGDCARPKQAKDGDVWPACTNIGVAYSSDGIHFDHAMDETAFQPGNQPGTRDIGQDDGALDLALWCPPPPPPPHPPTRPPARARPAVWTCCLDLARMLAMKTFN